jgi:hypothetical protein
VNGEYLWYRSFVAYVFPIAIRFGVFIEKRNTIGSDAEGQSRDIIVIAGGIGMSLELRLSASFMVIKVAAGIGVFAIIEGRLWIMVGRAGNIFDGSLTRAHLTAAIGIYAYVEISINVWVLSAVVRVWLQASITGAVTWTKGEPMLLTYNATMVASYHASCQVNLFLTSFIFTVSGSYPLTVSGQQLLKG